MPPEPGPADAKTTRPDVHEKVMAVLKRRGFVQPSYEIYGGVAGFWEYGPYGTEVKKNLEDLWRAYFVRREGMMEIFTPTISPEPVFRASGHLEKFADTVIECPSCGAAHRGDHLLRLEWKRMLDEATAYAAKAKLTTGPANVPAPLLASLVAKVESLRDSADRDPAPSNLQALLRGDGPLFHDRTLAEATFPNGAHLAATNAGITVRGKDGKVQFQALLTCPNCGKPMEAERAKASAFNLMFRTNIGPGGGRAGYMRPETAQGMFMAFSWLYRQNRDQLPFGAVQLGKAYRNEISPRQGFLRLREFHQMEAEVFFDPRSKTWPGWASARSRVLPLLARDTSEVVRLSVGDAVDRKIIANEALGFFLALTHEFLTAAGLPDGILRFRQHLASEMAHYSSDTWDAEFFSPRFGWVEIVGIADRTDFDLKSHEGVSGVELRGFRRFDEPREEERLRVVPDPAKLGPKFKGRAGPVLEAMKALRPASESIERVEIAVDGERVELGCEYFRVERVRETITGESFVPHVVEPSFGVDRILYALFESAYEEGRREWPVLHLAPSVAPAKVGVFPLMERDELDVRAQEIDADLRIRGVASYYDGTQSVGKRYARADEAGIPWCITVDYQTKEDGTVTVRDRETAEQIRVAAASVVDWIRERSAPRLARHR